jgi:hypothetical protein
MYGSAPTAGGGGLAGGAGLASTGFQVEAWLVVALALLAVGLIVLRSGRYQPRTYDASS